MGLAFYRGECLFIPKEGTRRLAPFKAATLDPITSLQPKDHLQAFADTVSDDDDAGAATPFPGVATISAKHCLLYTSPSPRDVEESRMPSSA